jgi:hypothetical protein
LRWPGGAAALPSLGFYFLLPPLLRRQTFVTRRQRRRTAWRGPGSSRGGLDPRADNRVEFSRLGSTAGGATGLHLDRWRRRAGLHLSRLGPGTGRDLARSGSARRSGFSRLSRDSGLDLPRSHRSRPRRGRGYRGERLGGGRCKLLFGRQLLNLLGHLRGQGQGGPGGQVRARQAPVRR